MQIVNVFAKPFKELPNRELHVYVHGGLSFQELIQVVVAKLNLESWPKLLGAYFF